MAVETNTASTKATVIHCLTGLRGAAALSVVYLHQNGWDHAQTNMGGWDTWHEFGHLAVIFFFVLSAFLLTYRGLYDYKRPWEVKYITVTRDFKIPVLSLRWISYFIRRLFRIYPCYVLTVLLAVMLPRFQGDEVQGKNKPYFFDFDTHKGIKPSELMNYITLYKVKGVFWTIPPEIEYYFIIPIIIVTFEIAQYFDFKMAGLDENGDPPNAEDFNPTKYYGDQPTLSSKVTYSFVKALKRSLFRTLHFALWTALAHPKAIASIHLPKGNRNHLPPHYFRFWGGSAAGIIFYLLERNGLVPSIETVSDAVNSARHRVHQFTKKTIFLICDYGCWTILAVTILTFPWYQHFYFNVDVGKDENWPGELADNEDPFLNYHENVIPKEYYERQVTSTYKPVFMSMLLILLIAYGGRKGTFANFFQWGFFTWCGEVSFPIYLTHTIAIREYSRLWLQFVSKQLPKSIDNVVLALVMSVLVATLMHFVIEKPFMKAGSYLVQLLRRTVFKPNPDPVKDVDELPYKNETA